MSLSCIFWKPRMLDPSKPSPSANMSSSSSPTGIEKCCQRPGRSTNLKSTILTPDSLAKARTSAGEVRVRGLSLIIRAPLFGRRAQLSQRSCDPSNGWIDQLRATRPNLARGALGGTPSRGRPLVDLQDVADPQSEVERQPRLGVGEVDAGDLLDLVQPVQEGVAVDV